MYKFQSISISICFSIITIFLCSCSAPAKIIKYEHFNNQLFTNSTLKEFYKSTPYPKLVLRVSESAVKTNLDPAAQKLYTYIYGVMENELLRLGFILKDRSNFNSLIAKTNSAELFKKELSDADLILEVVNMNDKVLYSTNKIAKVKKNSIEEETQSLRFTSFGAEVEYRLILIKTNEIAGTYKFYYEPCAHGCPITDFKLIGKEKDLKLNQGLDNQTMQNFVSTSIKELVYHLNAGDAEAASKKAD